MISPLRDDLVPQQVPYLAGARRHVRLKDGQDHVPEGVHLRAKLLDALAFGRKRRDRDIRRERLVDGGTCLPELIAVVVAGIWPHVEEGVPEIDRGHQHTDTDRRQLLVCCGRPGTEGARALFRERHPAGKVEPRRQPQDEDQREADVEGPTNRPAGRPPPLGCRPLTPAGSLGACHTGILARRDGPCPHGTATGAAPGTAGYLAVITRCPRRFRCQHCSDCSVHTGCSLP